MAVSSTQNSTGLASVFQAIRTQSQTLSQAARISPRERALRTENNQLSTENLQLEQRNRDLKTRNRELKDENQRLQQEVQSDGPESSIEPISSDGNFSGYPKAAAYRITARSTDTSGAGNMLSVFA